MKKRTTTLYKKKCIAKAKEIVRSKGYCERCGALSGDKQMQGSHIFPEDYLELAADPENIICLCAGCHKWKKNAWHKSPLEAAEWFHGAYPSRYEELKSKLYSSRIPDWELLFSELDYKMKLMALKVKS